jgi:leucyl/phenylalanyl-tRNA---protein transferase
VLAILSPDSLAFPDPDYALEEPNGLLAVGGDLTPERLLAAYRLGIFPWYEDGQPILWWSPHPRMVLFPGELHVSASLRKALRRSSLRIKADTAFDAVIEACAQSRPYASGTWITKEVRHSYKALHAQGFAHSVEAWQDGELVGGLYGIALGRVFFGESMFSRQDNASKIAFCQLVRQLDKWDYSLIDCQVASRHLASLGAREIARSRFRHYLPSAAEAAGPRGPWTEIWQEHVLT